MSDAFLHRWERRHDVLQRVKISGYYHRDRERVLAMADRVSRFVALLSGSAALGHVLGSSGQTWLLAIVAISSAFGLAFALGDRARQHADLATKWSLLEASILRADERDFTDADLGEWDSRRAEIEASEPPHSRSLVKEIQNRIALAEGRSDHVEQLTWVERWRARLAL